jgi:hypothetical protein
MQIFDHTAKPMKLWSYMISVATLRGSFRSCGDRGVIFCQKCAEEGRVSLFNHDNSSARAHAAAAKHEGGLVAIGNFRALLAEVVQKMVALHYWPIHTVEHPVMREYLGEGTLGKAHLKAMIDRLYELVVTEIGTRIAREEFLGMETDSWSRFGLSLFGLVALGRCSLVVGCRGPSRPDPFGAIAGDSRGRRDGTLPHRHNEDRWMGN